jgi:hypothetical protein
VAPRVSFRVIGKAEEFASVEVLQLYRRIYLWHILSHRVERLFSRERRSAIIMIREQRTLRCKQSILAGGE